MDWNLFSILIFLLVLAFVLVNQRSKIEVKWILFIRRTKMGRNLLNSIAMLSPGFWKVLGTCGVVIGFAAMFYGIYMLLSSIWILIITPVRIPPGGLVIPVPGLEPVVGWGFVGVPFWYWILSIASIFFMHEGAHGIMARADRIRIKSIGLLLLAIIPGAFVEPDEKALRKAGLLTKLRIYAAGSVSNFMLAAGIGIFFSFLFVPVFYVGAVGYRGYVIPNETENIEAYPAQLVNMSGPILSIDGIRIENTSALAQVLAATKPGQHISVKTTDGTFNLTLAENPRNKSIGFIGIGDVRDINPWYYFWKPTKLTSILREEYAPAEGCIWFLTGLLMWIIFLNFFVGIFNLLPIKPFDGGMLVEAFAKHLIPKHADLLVRAATMFTLTLIFLIFALSI